MSFKYNAEELANKIDHEGGVVSALDYGVRAEDILPGELRDLWTDLEQVYWNQFEPLTKRFYELLPEPWND